MSQTGQVCWERLSLFPPGPHQVTKNVCSEKSDGLFRCVCGFSFGFETSTGAKCQRCGRYFSPRWLLQSMSGAETTCLHGHEKVLAGQSEPLEKHEHIRHFQILEPLGQGAMGTVYHAIDKSLERYVAIKVLRSHSHQDEMQRNAILQEAKLQARLNHPNIVTVYYVATDDEVPFFAMEYVEGQSLQERLAQGPMEFTELLQTALQLGEALKHTADLGVVHGDIKPANILLSPSGEAKLSDFGLARPSAEASDRLGGTLVYMAPEVLRGDQPTFRSDMYSLGVTLFEATFGRSPFATQRYADIHALLARKEQESSFPSPWPTGIPQRWQQVLSSLLKPQPDQRPGSYEAMLGAMSVLRPRSFPDSGFLPRCMAWYVDNAMLFALLALPAFIAASATGSTLWNFSDAHPIISTLLALAVLPVPLLGQILLARWGTSPGKRLFRIRIVDDHGLQPRRSILVLRAAFQLLPIWALAAVSLVGNLHLFWLITPIVWISSGLLVLDALTGLLPQRGRTLHDRIAGTHVVVDVGDA